MGSLNKATVIGNLGNDAELRYTQSGRAVSNISIATSEVWTDDSGEKHENTEWHRCVIWGKMAESLATYLKEGKRIYLEGRLQTREWQDKDGIKRQSTEIVANNIVLLGSRGGGDAGVGREAAALDASPASGGGAVDQSEDDIPF